jgi:hypothetical protein
MHAAILEGLHDVHYMHAATLQGLHDVHYMHAAILEGLHDVPYRQVDKMHEKDDKGSHFQH